MIIIGYTADHVADAPDRETDNQQDSKKDHDDLADALFHFLE